MFPSFAVFASSFMEIAVELNEQGAVCVSVNVSRRKTAHLSKKAASCSLVAHLEDVDWIDAAIDNNGARMCRRNAAALDGGSIADGQPNLYTLNLGKQGIPCGIHG